MKAMNLVKTVLLTATSMLAFHCGGETSRPDASKQASLLTADESQQTCLDFADKVQSVMNEKVFCKLYTAPIALATSSLEGLQAAATWANSQGAEIDLGDLANAGVTGNLQQSCDLTYQICTKAYHRVSEELAKAQDAMCAEQKTQALMFADCSASVGEIFACVDDLAKNIQRTADAFTCKGLTKDAVISFLETAELPPASCEALFQKCPSWDPDQAGSKWEGFSLLFEANVEVELH